MKRFLFITVAILIAFPVFCQEEKLNKLENLENNAETSANQDTSVKKVTSINKETSNKHVSSDKQDTVIVEVGDEVFSIKERGDETRIKIGKKEFRVVENNNGVVVLKSSDKDSDIKKCQRFKGHLGGFEFGLNSFLSDYWSTSLKPEDNYFDLSTARSYNMNFLLPNLNIGFTKHLGIVTTLGINFNKYRFDGNNTIVKDEDGVIGPFYPDSPTIYTKSKLSTTYITLPVLLEAQIPISESNKNINVGAGVIGAVKLGSNTKVVYNNDGKQKEKNKDDFSLNTLRWGATGRIGYEFFQIYGTCYFTSMFENGKGPELYPFEVGIAFTFND